ncbi:SHOCT domain-containing protein [Catellatospora paridis]|uniref:SHOCT domain-containing protein n=1 Tax=Catellatospora paridis TaxID=1617086 RepID=UPI0012D3A922|nr:SHOCT domain-containing protein [Catellatospora paridis]
MEVIIPVIIVLAVVSFLWGRAHDSWFAKKIGEEVRGQTPPRQVSQNDPVVLLEKLHRLKEAGALTDAEYEVQKARILGG